MHCCEAGCGPPTHGCLSGRQDKVVSGSSGTQRGPTFKKCKSGTILVFQDVWQPWLCISCMWWGKKKKGGTAGGIGVGKKIKLFSDQCFGSLWSIVVIIRAPSSAATYSGPLIHCLLRSKLSSVGPAFHSQNCSHDAGIPGYASTVRPFQYVCWFSFLSDGECQFCRGRSCARLFTVRASMHGLKKWNGLSILRRFGRRCVKMLF